MKGWSDGCQPPTATTKKDTRTRTQKNTTHLHMLQAVSGKRRRLVFHAVPDHRPEREDHQEVDSAGSHGVRHESREPA